jgi:hypothetical protein
MADRRAGGLTSDRGIPAKFLLVIPGDGLHLPCHVVWRKEYRIGVAFDEAASA